MLPKEIAKLVPSKLMSEAEWRGLGVQQSQGWIHYMKHDPGTCQLLSFHLYFIVIVVVKASVFHYQSMYQKILLKILNAINIHMFFFIYYLMFLF